MLDKSFLLSEGVGRVKEDVLEAVEANEAAVLSVLDEPPRSRDRVEKLANKASRLTASEQKLK